MRVAVVGILALLAVLLVVGGAPRASWGSECEPWVWVPPNKVQPPYEPVTKARNRCAYWANACDSPPGPPCSGGEYTGHLLRQWFQFLYNGSTIIQSQWGNWGSSIPYDHCHCNFIAGTFDYRDLPNGGGLGYRLVSWVDCPWGDVGLQEYPITVDNHYLLYVNRGDETSPGDIKVKRLNCPGSGWVTEHDAPTGDALTCGSGHDDSCGHIAGRAHGYCCKQDTPPFTQSDPSDAKTYPTLASPNVVDSFDADDRRQYGETDVYNGQYYWVSEESIMGRYKIMLPNRTAPCGCGRTLLRIHGGGGHDWDAALNPWQYPLLCTYGCIRMYNAEIADLAPWIEARDDGFAVWHIYVPN